MPERKEKFWSLESLRRTKHDPIKISHAFVIQILRIFNLCVFVNHDPKRTCEVIVECEWKWGARRNCTSAILSQAFVVAH